MHFFYILCTSFIYYALKTTIFSARCLCHMESLTTSKAETPGGQTNRRFKCIVIKQIQNIMKYQLYANASKNNRLLKVVIPK